MRIDPYKHEQRYKTWKEKVSVSGMPNLSKKNSDIIIQYVSDMEHGLNVSAVSVKGGRSFIRLNTIKEKMNFFAIKFEELYKLKDITQITEPQLILFFSKMQKGEIVRKDGKKYISVNYFVKVFKAFWHWYQTINRKQGKILLDITIDLDSRGTKPRWVYLTEEQIKLLVNNSKFKYKVLIMFLFDSGIRSPTELVNIKVSDLYENCKELMIREDTSKTFGRKIKLMLCSEYLKDYIRFEDLKNEDYLFSIKPQSVNKYLKRLAQRVLGDENSLAGDKYSNLTMYDFRHCSCCYWLPRYKSESALKYRFGWKKSDKIHYYSEMLGMKDTITEEDLLIDTTKTELERDLINAKRRISILEENEKNNQNKLKEIFYWIEEVKKEVKLNL